MWEVTGETLLPWGCVCKQLEAMLEIYFKKLSKSKTVGDEIPSVFCFTSRMCGCVRVPGDVGVPGGELTMLAASVGGGAPAAEVGVKL